MIHQHLRQSLLKKKKSSKTKQNLETEGSAFKAQNNEKWWANT